MSPAGRCESVQERNSAMKPLADAVMEVLAEHRSRMVGTADDDDEFHVQQFLGSCKQVLYAMTLDPPPNGQPEAGEAPAT